MSRIGKHPVAIPGGVDIAVDGQTVKVTELRKAGTSLHASGTAVALEIVAVDAATVFGKASQTPV